MSEDFPGISPNFGSLAEMPNPSPEKKVDDDDDDDEVLEKKSINDIFETNKKSDDSHEDRPEKNESTVEKELPLKKLANDEKLLVLGGLQEDANQEVKEAVPDSVEESVAVAAATYLEVVNEKARNGEDIEEVLDPSLVEALDIAGLDMAEQGDILDPSEFDAAEIETGDNEPIADEDDNTAPSMVATPPNRSSTPPSPTPAGSPSSSMPSSGMPHTAGGGGSSGSGGPVMPGGIHNFGDTAYPNSTPNSMPNQPASSPEYINVRRSNRRHLLVGGLVGYMIGRRRGRIKTEKKLLPIQHTLEKEVTSLQQKITLREEKIRSIARDQLTKKPEMKQKMVERMQTLQEIKHAKVAETIQPLPESPEQNVLPRQPEKLGMFAMAAHRERAPEKLKDVALMSGQELLVIAANIPIEQSTIKKLFEAGRLDDQGLRRVVRAYLRGEKLDKVMRENLKPSEPYVSKEIYKDIASRAPAEFTASAQTSAYANMSVSGHPRQPYQSAKNTTTPPASPQSWNAPVPKSSKKMPIQKAFVVIAFVMAVAFIIWITSR